MSRPQQPRPSARPAAQTAALSRALAGAVDLSALKARATAPSPQPAAAGDRSSPGGSAWVVDVTEQTFQSEVVDRSMQVPVVVDLWASWCGPCKQLSPVLERLAAAGNGAWVLAKIDVDANPRIAQAFGVQSVPTVVAVAAGQPVDGFAGAQPEPQVRQWITALLDALRDRLPGIDAAEQGGAEAGDGVAEPVADPRFTAAEDAIDRGDYATAEAAYQDILDVEPANAQAKAALLQVRLLARVADADPDAVAKADAAPGDVDAQLAAADVQIAVDEVTEAFSRLVTLISRLSGDERDPVRGRLVELFELFEADDPRVAQARRALARVLF